MIRLNVIGQKEQKNIDDLLRSHALVLSLCVTVSICAVTIIALVIGRSYFAITLSSATNELSSTKIVSPAGETLPVLEVTDKINQELSVLGTSLADFQFDIVLVDVAKSTPDGISYSALSVTTKNGTLTAQGFATSRNEVPILESNLKKLPYLTNLVIQSSLSERTRIPVSISATIDRSKFIES